MEADEKAFAFKELLPAVEDDVVDTLVDRGESDVVVQELTVLHQHESVAGVEVGHVSVHHYGHQSGGGKRFVTN